MIKEHGFLLLFIIGAIVFMLVALTVARLIRPHRPNEEKLTTYECGEDPVGNARGQFNIRFYIVALIFVLFEVEILFLFPWATVFSEKSLLEQTKGRWGWFSLIEVIIFVFLLVVGLAYAWRKGFLEWIKPSPTPTSFKGKVPLSFYEKINQQYQRKSQKP
ncbi:MAG: NADH-quinone oxidoreductase subunit A [Flammeovirgaceae bacterium]|nr:NADH-quinone oxidoreductase subunit A [Flammeovirgaceae bacterium]MDW8288335.1 NADH-quinone oxidoreductase subunit A [Flammeovirgaceae bacterium]